MSPEPASRSEATILHVDMDAFFAAVEALDDPALAGRPLIVGGTGRHGVVASASYEARAYGVRSAMPSGQARRLCPHATFVPGRYDRYAEYSRRIHGIFQSYTPLVEGIALDEAFLDIAGGRRLFGTAGQIGVAIRRHIGNELGLSASVGIATSKFVAKLASEAAKPTASLSGIVEGPGVVVVEPGRELAFLHPKPVESLWGVGPATADRLRRLGVGTIGDLARVPPASLAAAVGTATGRHLHNLAWARDNRPVEPARDTKSVGHEETYARDRDDPADLRREVVRMADAVAGRLRAADLAGRTVTVKVRFGDFATITRSQTLPSPVDTGQAIAATGSALLAQVDVSSGVRLLGLSVSSLSRGAVRQLALDLGTVRADRPDDAGRPPTAPGWDETARAVDRVRDRFGDGVIGPAALLGDQRLRVARTGDAQWGPADRSS